MLVLLIAAIAQALPAIATAQSRPVASTPAIPGPMSIAHGEYHFPATIDSDVLPYEAIEIWARVAWPKDLSKPHPILFFLHGNHATCGSTSYPHYDNDCTYTHSGFCPAGMAVVKSHEGYNYLADQLASEGFIVVSINSNRGINCQNGGADDSGYILPRARLILRHMQLWSAWAKQGQLPSSLGLAQNAFVGKVDFQNIGLFGHSRGGEAVRAAYTMYRENSAWQTRIPGAKFKGIFEIGAVDGMADRNYDADDVAWNQVLPMCDGDVSDLEGRMPFERMLTKHKEVHATPKSLTMVWGANHNFFNSQWQRSDSSTCLGHTPLFSTNEGASSAQQLVATNAVSSFFLAHVGAQASERAGQMFDPLYSLSSLSKRVTRIDRDYITSIDDHVSFVVDSFDQATGISSSAQSNLSQGIEIENHFAAESSRNLPSKASIGWIASGANHFLQVMRSSNNDGIAAEEIATVDFRVSRQFSQVANSTDELGKPTPTDFSIQAVYSGPAGNGLLSRAVALSQYAELVGPVNYASVFQTVRIPVADFGLPNQAKFQGVRFTFDRSPRGEIYITGVRFTVLSIAELAGSASARSHVNAADRLSTNVDSVVANASVSDVNQPAGLTVRAAALSPIERHAASLVSLRKLPSLFGASVKSSDRGYEVVVQSHDNVFPVQDSLPTLVIDGQRFKSSRYPDMHHLNVIAFHIPTEAANSLTQSFAQPSAGAPSAHVEYGESSRKVWQISAP